MERHRRRETKALSELVDVMVSQVKAGRDFIWELPAEAQCDRTPFMCKLRGAMNNMNHHLHDFYVDACAYNLRAYGKNVRKRWRLLTSSQTAATLLRRTCPGCREHLEWNDVSPAAFENLDGRFPKPLVSRISQAVTGTLREEHSTNTLAEDIEETLLGQEWFQRRAPRGDDSEDQDRCDVFALSRQKLPESPPTGRALEQVRQMMMRVHRASGHSSMASLAKLLARRGAPTWAQERAKSLQCPDCLESRRPLPAPPSTIREPPQLWEMLGADVFEYSFVGPENRTTKIKGCIWHDRASGTAAVSMMKQYSDHWEPSSSQIIRCFIQSWLQYYPRPKWLLTDAALYFVSEETNYFLGRSGVGHLVSPAEAHWVLGAEERLIQKLKHTVDRLMRELPSITCEDAFRLAVHAHNSTIQPNTGFAPYQWSRGGVDEEIPIGVDPNKAFDKLLKQREAAGVAYRRAQAADQLSKLNNAVGRPRTKYEPGELVMVWRARKSAGKGAWTGPVRVISVEGSTLWLASGATLLRAKLNQVRPCSKSEELAAVASGASIYKLPVTMETLLRGFRGRFYENLRGNNPPREALEDTAQGEVRVPPRPRRAGEDRWELQGPWLVRVHNKPRLALFVPSKTRSSDVPVPLDQLTGERVTFVRSTGNNQKIQDDFLQGEGPGRCLSDRWSGETHFRIKREHPQGRDDGEFSQARPLGQDEGGAAASSRPPVPPQEPQPQVSQEPARGRPKQPSAAGPESSRGRSRSLRPPVPRQEPQPRVSQEPSGGVSDSTSVLVPPTPVSAMPGTPVPPTPVSAMPGTPDVMGKLVPDTPRNGPQESESPAGCPVSDCTLPGGHRLPHRDAGGNPFAYDKRTDTKIPVEESGDETEEFSSSGSELEEDDGGKPRVKRPRPDPPPDLQGFAGYAFEIEMDAREWKAFSAKPRKAHVYMSKKLQEKGKETNWRELSLQQKMEYDEAQAKEISNILKTEALRSLTSSELKNIPLERVMRMRWVLTTKSTGLAKARLVILGYQSPTLLSTQSSSPTLSRLAKLLLLTVVSNKKWLLESADVTSAFLQALSDLEKDDLYVCAPAELGAAFGGDGSSDGTILKVLRAFYGLVDSPRRWHETVTAVLEKQGWRPVSADRCLYVLFDKDLELVGIAGVHVDDFMIAGELSSTTYRTARESLEQAFTWGRWEKHQFEYAGCDLVQKEDYTIVLGQETYTLKWLEEAEVSPTRASQKNSRPLQAKSATYVASWDLWHGEPTRRAHSCQLRSASSSAKFPQQPWTRFFGRTS